ncbi:PfkB family carbohydrate kinase [Rhodopseudomonas sp. BR0G17]|uniref:PfkB family carbohydrate kinase n=1 Tax=Rhodopseudomonas sp. BR0G17 TaxID=2269368 RepID=UPI001FEDE2F8|nr:PfkB family carbohydrate kinase [Rhodopseudomonas sp. BR0G17]
MVEGEAVVRAGRAVYDHQGAEDVFPSNGSSATELAVVLNEAEASSEGIELDVKQVLHRHSAQIVVVKRGPRGATVYTSRGASTEVPAYMSKQVFKIGSGDVFSAAFAHFWGEANREPEAAADMASRCVATFVEGHCLPLEAPSDSAHPIKPFGSAGRIYLAGPFFDLAQRWLVEEARQAFVELGVRVFSPLHDVGTGLSSIEIAKADLDGLKACAAVFALLDGADPGTLFEVGYARALGKPVVCLAERWGAEELTMFAGSGCEVLPDFATAVYRAAWASCS